MIHDLENQDTAAKERPMFKNMTEAGSGLRKGQESMYLVSLYFDRQTEEVLQKHMKRTAEKTGNFYMLEHQIPPHLTIAACKSGKEEELAGALQACARAWRAGRIDWAAIGSFKPHVLFLMPVLNRYLHELCVSVNAAADKLGDREEDRYRPFGWMPHVTMARTLTEQQMLTGFRVLQANFSPFSGMGVRIGLARSSPYQEIRMWELPES